jgi:hypothetical protein
MKLSRGKHGIPSVGHNVVSARKVLHANTKVVNIYDKLHCAYVPKSPVPVDRYALGTQNFYPKSTMYGTGQFAGLTHCVCVAMSSKTLCTKRPTPQAHWN